MNRPSRVETQSHRLNAMTITFDAHRFKTAAQHYVQGRLDYPPELIERVVSLTGLGGHHRVLDLGCGPGFLAAGFAPYVSEVVGMDPEPAMLEQAANYAAARGARVKLIQGSSYDLGDHLGRFQLVTIGRAFHWMDRSATLDALARAIAVDGVVALFGDAHLELSENDWKRSFRSILEPFAEKDPAHGARHGNPAWITHEAVLLGSVFCRLQRISVVRRLKTPIERLLDRALSMSSTSPERLGADRDRLLESLRTVLAEKAVDGLVTEVVESEALLAFREMPFAPIA